MAKRTKYSVRFYKEIALSILAVMSVALLGYEFLQNPPAWQVAKIMRFDFFVAIIFLCDFIVEFSLATNKTAYFRKNWFLLLASIPLVDSWAEILRGLRLLALVRLIRAGEHLQYVREARKSNARQN